MLREKQNSAQPGAADERQLGEVEDDRSVPLRDAFHEVLLKHWTGGTVEPSCGADHRNLFNHGSPAHQRNEPAVILVGTAWFCGYLADHSIAWACDPRARNVRGMEYRGDRGAMISAVVAAVRSRGISAIRQLEIDQVGGWPRREPRGRRHCELARR